MKFFNIKNILYYSPLVYFNLCHTNKYKLYINLFYVSLNIILYPNYYLDLFLNFKLKIYKCIV